jgi:hypothetical protein
MQVAKLVFRIDLPLWWFSEQESVRLRQEPGVGGAEPRAHEA